jgi:hypothetical protein
METWDNDDHETPIEEFPGYLGHTMDYDFFPGTELESLENIDLKKYGELVDEHGGERRLNIDLRSGKSTILFHAYDSIVDILDQLPTVKVSYDAHASGLGPASAAIYVFFIADGVGITELEASIAALTTALKSDFASLEKLAQQQRG